MAKKNVLALEGAKENGREKETREKGGGEGEREREKEREMKMRVIRFDTSNCIKN
jgi:hypothetical protein